jgi:hypothetical protein
LGIGLVIIYALGDKKITHTNPFVLFFISIYGLYRDSVSKLRSWRELAGTAHVPVEATKNFYPYPLAWVKRDRRFTIPLL